MNEATVFLAKIIGPILSIFGLGIILNPKFYLSVYKDFRNEPLALMLTSMALIAFGISILIKHFVWTSLPEVLISIIGLAMLMKGIFLALFPKSFKKLSKVLVSKNLLFYVGIIWLIGGIYLTFSFFI